jgi:periplasmic protein TonB
MEASKILTADVLDIIFNDRNKDYGAYELRSHYKQRLILSLAVMGAVCLLLIGGYVLAGKTKYDLPTHIITPPNTLVDLVPDKPVPPLPPPPPKPPIQQVAQRSFTKPVIVTVDVPEDEKPPVNETLENVKISDVYTDGPEGDIITPPNEAVDRGIITGPKEDEGEKIFNVVEIESSYPGGLEAWRRFLIKTFRYPDLAIANEIQGTVVVQFIVDKEGVVSNVEVLSGPEELRQEAIRVINKSGKWTAAIQNGKPVKSYKRQPIVFKLSE